MGKHYKNFVFLILEWNIWLKIKIINTLKNYFCLFKTRTHGAQWHKFSQAQGIPKTKTVPRDVLFELWACVSVQMFPPQPHLLPASELWAGCAGLPLAFHLRVLQMAVLSRKENTGK